MRLPITKCPKCRAKMREWARAWRRATFSELKNICLLTALEWRSGPCIHR